MPKPLMDVIVRSRRYLSVGAHLVLVAFANRLAFMLRFDGAEPAWAINTFAQTLPWLLAIRGLAFLPFGVYQGLWKYASIFDLGAILGSVAVSTAAFAAVIYSPLGPDSYPRSILVIDALLLVLMLGGLRLGRRLYSQMRGSHSGKRVLIVGAGDAGELVARDIRANPQYGYNPLGFVDDDPAKRGHLIHGLRVLGTTEELANLTERLRPDEILIAAPSLPQAQLRRVVRTLEPFKVPIKTVPRLRDIIDGNFDLKQIRSLDLEDILAREPVKLDTTPVRHLIRGRRVLVTGAGGSIGSELCRQIAGFAPAGLVMLDRYENTLHAVRLELEGKHSKTGLYPVIADVTDEQRMAELFAQHRPEIVFHAAAHKHVPLMEEHPCEAIKNNVRGTRILAAAADQAGVDRFIFISTDKAVNPTSVMGASKRVAELVVHAQAQGSGTSFCIVRFGNVLGSNGSVVPRFLDQIRAGGPVTVTHPDMRRFFMLIPEAVQLVLHAASQADAGSTYVLEMGEQIKLVDVARDLIRLSGFVPDEDVRISFIGLRPGEKLYEELVGTYETAGPSRIEKIQKVTSTRPPDTQLSTHVGALEELAASNDVDGVMWGLRQLLPEYAPPGAAAADVQLEPDSIAAAEQETAAAQCCPECEVPGLHRSHARTLAERVRRDWGSQRLYRCHACGWRGWLAPLEFGTAASVEVAAEPDLASLDASAPSAAAPRRVFAPRDLN
jgi:FlaA1/EpsC-like NDP-sugar epimerase